MALMLTVVMFLTCVPSSFASDAVDMLPEENGDFDFYADQGADSFVDENGTQYYAFSQEELENAVADAIDSDGSAAYSTDSDYPTLSFDGTWADAGATEEELQQVLETLQANEAQTLAELAAADDPLSEEEPYSELEKRSYAGTSTLNASVQTFYMDHVPDKSEGNLDTEIVNGYQTAMWQMSDGTVQIKATEYPDLMKPVRLGYDLTVIKNLSAPGTSFSEGRRDISDKAEYDAETGILSLPAEYYEDDITIIWYRIMADAVEVPVSVRFINAVTGEENAIEQNFPEYASTISVHPPEGEEFSTTVITQNALPVSTIQANSAKLSIGAPATGGMLTIYYTFKSDDPEEAEDTEAPDHDPDSFMQQTAVNEKDPEEEAYWAEFDEKVKRGENWTQVPGYAPQIAAPALDLTDEERAEIESETEASETETQEDVQIDLSAVRPPSSSLSAPAKSLRSIGTPEDASFDPGDILSGTADGAEAGAPDASPELYAGEQEPEETEEEAFFDVMPLADLGDGGFGFNTVLYAAQARAAAGGGGGEVNITMARVFNADGRNGSDNNQYWMKGTYEAFGYNEALVVAGQTVDGVHPEYREKTGFYVQILGAEDSRFIMDDYNQIGRRAKNDIRYQRQVGNNDYQWITNEEAAREEPNASAIDSRGNKGIFQIWTERGQCGSPSVTNHGGRPTFDPSRPSTLTLKSVDGIWETWEFRIKTTNEKGTEIYQDVIGELRVGPPSTGLVIRKTVPDWAVDFVEDNSFYDFGGATFELWRDGTQFYDSYTLARGEKEVVIDPCPAGHWKIIESVVPENFEARLAGQGQQLEYWVDVAEDGTVSGRDWNDAEHAVLIENIPQMDPLIGLAMGKKVDPYAGWTALPGAKFHVKWYKGLHTQSELASLEPTREWVFQTCGGDICSISPPSNPEHCDQFKADIQDYGTGWWRYDDHWLCGFPGVPTHELFHNKDGKPSLPLGTVMITEVEAPDGYQPIKGDFVETIRIGEQDQAINREHTTYRQQNVWENFNGGAFTFQKLDFDSENEEGVYEVKPAKHEDGTPWVNGQGQVLDTRGNPIIDETKTKRPIVQGTSQLGDRKTYPTSGLGETPTKSVGPASYSVYLKEGGPVYWPATGKTYQNGEKLFDFQTDVFGQYSTPNQYLPYATYEIVENSPAPGLTRDSAKDVLKCTVVIDSGERKYLDTKDTTIRNHVWRGGVQIQKRDSQSGTISQGNASLKGAWFMFYNLNLEDVYIPNKTGDLVRFFGFKSSSVIDAFNPNRWPAERLQEYYMNRSGWVPGNAIPTVFYSNDRGFAATDRYFFPVGVYRCLECKAPRGYNISVKTIDFEISENGQIVSLTDADRSFYDDVVRGGVKIWKRDKDLGDDGLSEVPPYSNVQADWTEEYHHCLGANPLGAGSLEGITFKVWNRSNAAVNVKGTMYAPGTVCLTLKTDKNGYAESGRWDLPCGTYEVTEDSANPSYNVGVNGEELGSWVFSIHLNTKDELVHPENSGYWPIVGVQDGNADGFFTTSAIDHGLYKVFAWEKWENNINLEDHSIFDPEPSNMDHGYWNPYDWWEGDGLEDSAVRGDLTVYKLDMDYQRGFPQGDATFEGTELEVINKTGHTIKVDGNRSVEPDGCVCTLTTDKFGYAATPEEYLPSGKYVVREKDPPDGYQAKGFLEREFEITVNEGTRGLHAVLENFQTAIVNYVNRGSLCVQKQDFAKVDSGFNDKEPQGDTSFAGTVFQVYNRSQSAVWITDATGQSGRSVKVDELVCEITAGADGIARTRAELLPYGTYGVVEKTPPDGYYKSPLDEDGNPIEKTVEIREHGVEVTAALDDPFVNEVHKGAFTVAKWDQDTSYAQGDATLDGTVFVLKNVSAHSIVLEEEDGSYTEVRSGEDLPIRLTTVGALASTPEKYLPIGTYTCREETPPEGYALGTNPEITFLITKDGEHIYKTSYIDGFKNIIFSGAVKVGKRDSEVIMGNDPQGSATFTGTVFEIINRSEKKQNVRVGGKEYAYGKVVMTLTAGPDGTAQTPERTLPYGTYGVREKSAPEGYTLNTEEISFRITTDGELKDLSIDQPIRNEVKRFGIRVQKFDSERGRVTSGDPAQGGATLEGTKIEIINRSDHPITVPDAGLMKKIEPGSVVCTLVTDKDGRAQTPVYRPEGSDIDLGYLPYGSYEVREVDQAKVGIYYCYLPTPGGQHTVSAKQLSYWNGPVHTAAENATYELITPENGFRNDVVRGGVTAAKKDAETRSGSAQGSATLNGAILEIYNKNDNVVIVNGQTYQPGAVVAEIETDINGVATTSETLLPFGDYSIKEKYAPVGYLLDRDSEIPFSITLPGQKVNIEGNPVRNIPKKFGITVAKRDMQTGSTEQGNAAFANAVFEIVNDNDQDVFYNDRSVPKGTVITTLTTNAEGTATTGANALPVGKYTVREAQAPKGYLDSGVLMRKFEVIDESLPEKAGAVRWQNGLMLDLTDSESAIKNDVLRGGVKIQKRDAFRTDNKAQGNASLAGAVFTVFNKSNHPVFVDNGDGGILYGTDSAVGSIITDENGVAVSDNLWLSFGKYMIKETTAPTGYLISEEERTFNVEINGKIVDLTANENSFHEIPARGGLELEKWDEELVAPDSQGDAVVAGAVFEIINRSTNSVIVDGKEYAPSQVIKIGGGDLVTNENGYACTPRNILPYGMYEIREKTPPTGYLGGAPSQFITINSDGQWISLTTHGKNFENKVQRGTMDITKEDAETGGTPQGDARLDGAEYELYNISNRKILAGGEIYEPDTEHSHPVYKFVTDENGYACVLTDGERYESQFILPYGRYELIETRAPEGYNNTDTKKVFTIDHDQQFVHFTGLLSGKDEVIRAGVKIRKVDDVTLENPQGEGTLEEATFHIINRSKNPVRVLGREYGYDAVVYTLHTNALGFAETASDLLPYGTYAIKEATPPDGYIKNETTERIVNIREDGIIYDLTGENQQFANEIIRGGMGITKYDTEHPTMGVGGALIEIVNDSTHSVVVNGETYGPGDVVLTGVTDDNGYFGTLPKALPYGNYTVREAAPPTGFHVGEDSIIVRTFTIRTEGQWVDLTPYGKGFRNAVIRGDLYGTKVVAENSTIPIPNVPFRITNDLTGEWHILKTDANGYFSTQSSHNPHAQNTNRGETSRDGVWFGPPDMLDENKGALPYGTYTIDEMPCEENKGRMLLKGLTVTISTPLQKVDMGTLLNYINEPHLSTQAADDLTRTRQGYQGQKRVIVDVVYYAEVTPGARYRLVSYIVDGTTGQTITPKQEQWFTPTASDGTETVSIDIDTTGRDSVVVFEELYDINGSLIAKHCDRDDRQQTVTISKPTVSTSATFVDGRKNTEIKDVVTIYDDISYDGLIPGQVHTIRGRLVYKGSATPVMRNGAPVTNEITFTPQKTSGLQRMTFEVDAVELAGKAVTVLETIEYKSEVIASHEDPNDSEQTVNFSSSSIGTTLTTKENLKQADVRPAAQLVDRVECRGLSVGTRYTLEGRLVFKDTEEPVIQNGFPVTGRTLFTATSTNLEVQVPFTFNTMELQGREVVCYERLTIEGQLVAAHEDPNDSGQTVLVPDLGLRTHACGRDGEKILQPGSKVEITDRVSYSGLIPGMTYTLHGVLMTAPNAAPVTLSALRSAMDEADVTSGNMTSQALDALMEQARISTYGASAANLTSGMVPLYKDDGTLYEITKKFIPSSASGEQTITFEVDTRMLSGQKIVVFEDLSISGTIVAEHKDPNDEDQTVRVNVPGIGTKAEGSDGSKNIAPSAATKIIDTVSCVGLTPGETYTLTGTIMDKSTGQPVYENNQPVTVRAEFTPELTEEDTRVTFTLDTSALIGHSLVVFEQLYLGDTLLATHEDISDVAQTVMVKQPAVSTYAESTYSAPWNKKIYAEKDQVIVDTITYSGLEPGQEYTAVGSLYDVTADAPVMTGSTPVTSTGTFVPTASDGSVKVTFRFNATGLQDHILVVYEEILSGSVVVGAHKEKTDTSQQVSVDAAGPVVPTDDGAEPPKDTIAIFCICGALLAAALIFIVHRRRRKAHTYTH